MVLDAPAEGVELRPLSEANEAYFIVCGDNDDEYFTLENRQQTGWDKGLPGHGLIISHVHYVPSLWASNRVNTTSSGYEHVALVPADNMATDATMAGDPFPAAYLFKLRALRRDFTVSMTLSRINTSDDWEKRTEVSSKYKERRVNEIMRQLISVR